jgi:hypothetical protein
MAVFTRDDDTIYSIPLSFAAEHLKECPFCSSENPKWLTKKEWKLFGHEYYFKCPKCASIISIDENDVTGLSLVPTTFASVVKKCQGKDSKSVYVRIIRMGDSMAKKGNVLNKKEITLEELFSIVD